MFMCADAMPVATILNVIKHNIASFNASHAKRKYSNKSVF